MAEGYGVPDLPWSHERGRCHMSQIATHASAVARPFGVFDSSMRGGFASASLSRGEVGVRDKNPNASQCRDVVIALKCRNDFGCRGASLLDPVMRVRLASNVQPDGSETSAEPFVMTGISQGRRLI
jgi:hypothetical protein